MTANDGINHHILSVTVVNRAGVLARVAGLFARRGFNIFSLAVDRRAGPLVRMIDDADPAAGDMRTVSPVEAHPQDTADRAQTVRIQPDRNGGPS